MIGERPAATSLTAPFWQGVDAGELRVQRCAECGRMRFYPTEACPHCASRNSQWVALSGRGRIYSWTIVHRSVDLEWQARAPYVAAIVEIEEQDGVLIPGLLTGIDPGDVRANLMVEAWYENVEGGAMSRWRPAASVS